MNITDRRIAFKKLHQTGCFVLPNPWDIGSAKILAGMGFKALATTSSGYAWSQDLPDGALTRAAVLAHLKVIVEATDLPVNADFESGFGVGADRKLTTKEVSLVALSPVATGEPVTWNYAGTAEFGKRKASAV